MTATTNEKLPPAFDSDEGGDAILETGFTSPQRDSVTLMQAASNLIEAETSDAVALALDYNLKVWVAIRSIVNSESCPLTDEIKDNLRSLSRFATEAAIEAGAGQITSRTLISLARINMLIAEGLLRAEQNRLIAERAYAIWEEEGRPEGRSVEHWIRAEAEIHQAAAIIAAV